MLSRPSTVLTQRSQKTLRTADVSSSLRSATLMAEVQESLSSRLAQTGPPKAPNVLRNSPKRTFGRAAAFSACFRDLCRSSGSPATLKLRRIGAPRCVYAMIYVCCNRLLCNPNSIFPHRQNYFVCVSCHSLLRTTQSRFPTLGARLCSQLPGQTHAQPKFLSTPTTVPGAMAFLTSRDSVLSARL